MFYLLNKRKGISSFKAIREFAKENNIKKVGHTGTLDPMATGLLLIATDDDTKLINYIDKGMKSYIAEMKLGYDSDTLDIEGEVVRVDKSFNIEEAKDVIMSFEKEYDQMPPKFSAKKINGKRAYELARDNVDFELKPNNVKINKILNINIVDSETIQFEVEVSRGTYIRSLIRDIGETMGTNAIMSALERNKLSRYNISDANKEISSKELISLPHVEIQDMKRLFDGKEINIDEEDGEYAVIFHNEVIGIVNISDKKLTKRRLFGKKYERILNESN